MKKIWLLTLLCLLSACGFHLKGYGTVADTLPYRTWQVEGQQLQQALENALRHADAQIVDTGNAQATLKVNSVVTRKDIYTITRAAEVSEYLLMLRVEAQAYRHQQPVGEPMVILVQRKMDYADSQVLGKQEEEATIWSEMRTDAAQQIIRRLSFIKAN